ncbi:MAG: polymerase IV protein, partial [Parcubacteria group bacterium GW2011_GWA2_38_13]
MQKIIMHIDMNSYFASVEQQANPFLRGVPVAVCAYLSPRGCIVASSTEAKILGIKTGMRVADAQKIFPKTIFLENEPAKYRSVTKKIFSIFSDYTDHMEPYSIDEAFLDLTNFSPLSFNSSPTGGEERPNKLPRPFVGEGWGEGKINNNDFQSAHAIALEIKQRIQKEVGEWLKCSIGISYTRWLAKFAGDRAEKNTIFILTPEILEKTLSCAKLTDAWGIGSRIGYHLNQMGIRTLLDLKRHPVQNLMQALGKMGYFLWANVNGIEIEGVKCGWDIAPKSIGHSYCIPNKTTDLKYLRAILMKLCEKTGQRLRNKSLEAKNISAGLSYVSEGGRYKSMKTPEHIFDTPSIFRYANSLLFSNPLTDRVKMLAISVSGLIEPTNQLSFFSNTITKKNLARAC